MYNLSPSSCCFAVPLNYVKLNATAILLAVLSATQWITTDCNPLLLSDHIGVGMNDENLTRPCSVHGNGVDNDNVGPDHRGRY